MPGSRQQTGTDERSVAAADARRDARSRRLSATLCLAIGLAALGILHRLSFGFELWTFEDRRQRLIATDIVQVAPIALRLADRQDGRPGRRSANRSDRPFPLWHADAVAPAAYLVDFIYTRCPGVCRTLGTEFQQMQRELSLQDADQRVHLVSVSFDVEHDTVDRLAEHARRLQADPALWSFAVPAAGADARTLLSSLGVIAIPDGAGGFVHNGDIHLLDARGRLHATFDYRQWSSALAAARRLAAREP